MRFFINISEHRHCFGIIAILKTHGLVRIVIYTTLRRLFIAIYVSPNMITEASVQQVICYDVSHPFVPV